MMGCWLIKLLKTKASVDTNDAKLITNDLNDNM